jgi:hypothetical protein
MEPQRPEVHRVVARCIAGAVRAQGVTQGGRSMKQWGAPEGLVFCKGPLNGGSGRGAGGRSGGWGARRGLGECWGPGWLGPCTAAWRCCHLLLLVLLLCKWILLRRLQPSKTRGCLLC